MLQNYIKQQTELVTQQSRQIAGTQGPLANFLRTLVMGDGKSSRMAGLNFSKMTMRMKTRTMPKQRMIGPKTAGFTNTIKEFLANNSPDQKLMLALSPIPGVWSMYSGAEDSENNMSIPKQIGHSLIPGAATGLVTGALSAGLFSKEQLHIPQNKSKALIIPAHMIAQSLAYSPVYFASKSVHPIFDKLFVDKNENKS